MKVLKHHGKWRYDFWKDGIRYRKGGYETEEEAIIAKAKAMKEAPRMNLDFTHLCEGRLEELKSKRTPKHFQENEKLLNNLTERWAPLKDITRDDVENYLNEIGIESHQKANKDLRLIKALFNHGIEREWFTYNPASKIKPHPVKVKRRYIPPLEDILNILTQATDEQRRYLLTIIYTAARVREINQLKWTDVYPDYLILKTRKSRNSDVVERPIPITDSMRTILTNTPKTSEYVFTNKRTKKNFDYRKKMMKVLCEKAKVSYFTFHCLRHFAASLLAKERIPLTDIQKILGHQRATTTDIYLRSLGNGVVEAAKKLEAIPPEPTPKSK